ncbi:broad substrate specificity ATP-binding cassette transporter ABCG2-like [Sphaerodactylus townsendi]|uniref:broad substrate specificity ATP-binding cassette transporter ABCG2-like n=1 Tax=Sphaerodactylus townsendi TaxID=933632 RepID=UPI002026D376|nr:broad substrate specificity ATP-binding cassette transporter ABCG2-like [Sphaerodactylus townsendi]
MKRFTQILNEDHAKHADEPKKRTVTVSENMVAPGSTVTFYNISYKIKVKTGYYGFRKTVGKVILTDISGVMKPGLNAILGPTGSGKSSLLDILATRKDPHGLTGEILINGFPQPPQFKCMSGYVVQDDIVMGTLTVRENLEFSAALRLPSSMSSEEKKGRVDQVIVELDLTKVENAKVGTQLTRGISGGEKKRVCIGLELITHPPILFLDEPTTGLDSSTANSVMELLKRMSVSGKTIIFSIHQPRYSIFKLFDSLTLLAAGKLVYHGLADKALSYFLSLGFDCEAHNNPADFFMDIINGDSTGSSSGKIDIRSSDLEETEGEAPSIAEILAKQYSQSAECIKMKEKLKQLSLENKNRKTSFNLIPYSTSFFHQLKWVSRRTFKNLIGNPQNSIAQICITTVLGIAIGILFANVENDVTGIQNRVGVLFFLTTNQCLNSVTTVELFITEKRIFMHEYISGYYRVSAYFFSKILADMIPMRTLPGIIFTCINYFIIGFKPTAEAFFIMMITLILIAYAASSLSLAIATGQSVSSVANLLINICFVFMILFSGLLVNITTISPWLLWLQYFSITRYGLNALQINEFTGLKFCKNTTAGLNVTCITPSPFTICTGEEYLKIQGIDITRWGVCQNYVALVCMTVIFLAIAYTKLRLLKKYT